MVVFLGILSGLLLIGLLYAVMLNIDLADELILTRHDLDECRAREEALKRRAGF